MHRAPQTLADWKQSLCKRFEVGGLFSRNAIAYKWKAPFRSLTLRETVAWRVQDLLTQSYVLHDAGHALGARILLRSALETVAILVYLNHLTRKVVAGTLGFHEFSSKTTSLLLGSRDKSTSVSAINIITVLQKCEALYPGIEALYAALSESAHPNHEGICLGYSDIDPSEYVTTFSNKWASMYSSSHVSGVELCMSLFDYEYNEEWPAAFEALEQWIVVNDTALEATKHEGV